MEAGMPKDFVQIDYLQSDKELRGQGMKRVKAGNIYLLEREAASGTGCVYAQVLQEYANSLKLLSKIQGLRVRQRQQSCRRQPIPRRTSVMAEGLQNSTVVRLCLLAEPVDYIANKESDGDTDQAKRSLRRPYRFPLLRQWKR